MFKKKICQTVIISMMIVFLGIMSETYGADGDNNFMLAFTDTPTDMLDTNTRDIVAGSDVDQDGKYEIIVTDYDNGGQVHVFEVTGDNTMEWVWSSPGTNSLNPFAAREVKTGDLDNDGIGEILMSISANDVSSDSSGIYVYEWDGVNDNGYIPMGIITIDLSVTEGYTEDFIVEDIDGDGITEAVFLNNGPDEVDNCYIISISGTFETTWSQVTEATFTRSGGDIGGSPYDVAVGDLDGDTFKEVIFSIIDSGAVFVVEATDTDTYVPSAYIHIDTTGNDGYSLEGMAAADFNGDGADELFVAIYPGRQLAVVTGGTDVSTITFEDNVRIIRSEGQGVFGMAIGNQDHGAGSDGPDIYLSDYGNSEEGGYIQNFEFTGTDIFDPSSYIEHVIFQDTEISNPMGLFQLDAPPIDLDGDGNLELLLTYTGTDLPEDVYLRIFEFDTNTPTLTLTAPNGGEDWGYATVQNITWTSENYIGGMRIEYSPDNGSNWNEIISYTSNDGNYDWSIPNDPSTTSLVRISKIADGPPSDESDGQFTISAPPMAAITFIIDDSQFQELTDCWLKGSWDNNGFYDSGWSGGEIQMYDDGTNGDLIAGDNFWSVQLDLVVDNGAETWEWGALDGPGGSWLIEGANQQFTLPDNSPQTLTYVREGYSTPCSGVSWTLDDLVANSGGIVTGSSPNYTTQKTIVVCASDELTIAAGSTLEFVKGELRIFGSLNVEGQSGNMVTFTSNSGTPAPDDWGTIRFKSGSAGSIEYANVEYSHNGLWCDSGSPSIVTNSIFNNMSNEGLYIKNITSGVFEHNVISNCGWNGASLENSSIQFTNNTIFNTNTGIRVSDVSTADIDSNIVYNSNYDGVAFYNSSPNFRYNLIYNNNDEGIDCSESSPNIINNTIDNNGLDPAPEGSNSCGIDCGESSSPVIKNNIITNNTHYGIWCRDSSFPQISYNDVWGYTVSGYEGCSAGTGDIDEDPVYVDAGTGDYSLQGSSPCIDTGDPASPLDPDGTRADMGAYYYYQSTIQHFTWTETEDYYPIVVNSVTLDGQPIEISDEVGVFFRDDNTDLICGGGIVWDDTGLKAWEDDSQTPEKDGFESGEDLVYRLWDASAQEEYGFLSNITYTVGDGQWGTGTYAQVDLAFITTRTLTIDLNQNWNWISSNNYPPDPDMEVVWSAVADLEIVKGYDGFYIPGVINDIGDWDIKQMYTAYLTNASTLEIEGEPADPELPIELQENWNWVSYLPDNNIDAETALASIVDYLNIAKSYEGFYIPGVINDIGDMVPSKGYKMHTTQACTLIYPTGRAKAGATVIAKTADVESDICRHFVDYQPTEDYQALVVQEITGIEGEIAPGDELGIYSESGLCIGGTVLTERYPQGLMIWMDDSRTDIIDGGEPGEKMELRLWNASTDTEYRVEMEVLTGSEYIGKSSFTEASLEVDFKSAILSIPTSYALDQNYPNPFNPQTTIRYSIVDPGEVSLVIYDLNGQLIKRLESGYKDTGFYQIVWDGSNEMGSKVASGVYICKMDAGQFTAVRKMVLLK